MKNTGIGFEIVAKADKAEIYIYDRIGKDMWGEGFDANAFIAQLKALGNVKVIDIHINSPGGSVWDGTAIYNQLVQHPAQINVYIDGVAASIASIIAMSGDTINMPSNALMMIHNPAVFAGGTSEDLRKAADMLDKVKETLINAYEKKTGLKRDKLAAMMDEETWMNAQDAKELGFIDNITDEVKMAAHFDLSMYKNIPDLTALKAELPPEIVENKKGDETMSEQTQAPVITAEYLKSNYPDIVNQIKAEGYQDGVKAGTEAGKKDGIAEGKKAERDRIKGIEDIAAPGTETLVNECKFDGETSPEAFAVKVLAFQKQQNSNALNELKQDTPPPVQDGAVEAETITVSASGQVTKEACEAEWNKSAELQKTYRTAASYYHFTKAQAEGKVRLLSK